MDDAVVAILATARLPRERDYRGGALVLALRDCGLRRSEAAALVWSDIERWDGDALDELRKLRKDYGNASPAVFGMAVQQPSDLGRHGSAPGGRRTWRSAQGTRNLAYCVFREEFISSTGRVSRGPHGQNWRPPSS